MKVPETVIGAAIGPVLRPRLAERLAHDDSAGFNLVTARGVRLIRVFPLPTAIALGLILPTLVPWVFGFDAEGTRQVTSVAQMFLVGLAGHALLEGAARTFYARHDARTPLTASLLNFGVFLALAPLLARQFGAAGIALANSISFTLEALLLLGWGWRRGQRFAVGGALARPALAGGGGLALGFGAMWVGRGGGAGA